MRNSLKWVLALGLLLPLSAHADTTGSATGGTAATQSNLIGGVYRPSPLTLLSGQQAGFNVDINGNLIVDTNGGSGGTSNVQGLGTPGTPLGGVITVQGVTSMTPFLVNTSTSMGANVVGGATSPAYGWVVGGVYQTSPVSISNGNWSSFLLDSQGALDVDNQYYAGATNTASNSPFTKISVNGTALTLGQATMANSVPVVLASNQTSIPVSLSVTTTGGVSTYFNSALTNTASAVKTSAGTLTGIHFDNTAGSTKVYVQIFDLATGSVTPGVTTPKNSWVIPANSIYDYSFGSYGVAFSTAITIFAATTSTGGTAPATSIVTNIYYK